MYKRSKVLLARRFAELSEAAESAEQSGDRAALATWAIDVWNEFRSNAETDAEHRWIEITEEHRDALGRVQVLARIDVARRAGVDLDRHVQRPGEDLAVTKFVHAAPSSTDQPPISCPRLRTISQRVGDDDSGSSGHAAISAFVVSPGESFDRSTSADDSSTILFPSTSHAKRSKIV